MNAIDELIEGKRILICVGTGGVGKTTISASIALQGMLAGKKTLALTVDPSRRLATSLGLDGKAHHDFLIEKERFKEFGVTPESELYVTLMDVRRAFDELVEKLAPSESAKRKILSNRYYQNIADSIAGSHEYMAMETLLSAHEKEQYDLIVVDTPPSPQISDLLSAPRRLTSILDAGFLRWVSKSYGIMNSLSFGLTRLWGSLVMGLVERIVGVEVLRDVWEFFVDFDPISEPLKQRAQAIAELLKSPDTVFLIVTSARKSSLYDSLALYKMLRNEGYGVGAIIANRVYTENGFLISEREIENGLGECTLAGKILANYANYKRLIEAERENMEEFKKRLRAKIPVISIPFLDNEVYNLERLFELRGCMFKSRH